MSGLGTSTQSSAEQSQTSYPQWTQDEQANTFYSGKGMIENFLRNPQYAQAGMTTDQRKALDLARESAQKVFTAPQLMAPGGGANLEAAYGTAAQGTAAQVTPDAIMAQLNPYLKSVGNTTLDNMRREYSNADAGLAAKYAAAGSFGGSGDALARGQAARGYNQNVGSTIAQLQSAGYDKATAIAMANAQMSQQTGIANTQNQQQVNLANQAALNAMRSLGADYGLKQVQVEDSLRSTQLAREQASRDAIMQGGNAQQKQFQGTLDIPWTMLDRLNALTPRQVNSQTNSQKESESTASPASTFGSIASGLGSLGIKFSDARMKEDIRKIGALPNGLGVYNYRWIGDDKMQTGLIAQEVQQARPEAVHEAPNGYLMVDYGKAVGEA